MQKNTASSPQIRFPALFAARPSDSHKGSFGTLAIIGGAAGMSGALVLAASAALQSGAGRVYAVFCQETLPVPWISQYPEIMLATNNTILQNKAVDTWAVGCGLGTDDYAQRALAQLIDISVQKQQPLVIDADALNILSQSSKLHAKLLHNTACTVLTPHPAEAARLLTCDTRTIQQNRRQSALCLVKKFRSWIVLKGHQTIVASPKGDIYQNDSGNPALATAGSGDVLTGMIAAFLAQQIPPEQAIPGAVWLHGKAADEYCIQGIPPIGLLAGEIAPMVRRIRQQFSINAQA